MSNSVQQRVAVHAQMQGIRTLLEGVAVKARNAMEVEGSITIFKSESIR
jgi:hypothetical protein